MVRLHFKRGEESQFLYETNLSISIEKLTHDVVAIFNGRLKISRICAEMNELVEHGTMYPTDMIGLTEEQWTELKLVDTWGDKCTPPSGWVENRDEIGRRNGRQPEIKMQKILKDAIEEAKKMIEKNKVQMEQCLVQKDVQNALDILRGAVMIVYPMNLPPHDPIRMEFLNIEDLAGTQAQLEVIEPIKAQLWFAGKQMLPDKTLADYLGKNDKCKAIVKICKMNEGAPGREPVFTEKQRKEMMMHAYRRQEELKVSQQLKHFFFFWYMHFSFITI